MSGSLTNLSVNRSKTKLDHPPASDADFPTLRSIGSVQSLNEKKTIENKLTLEPRTNSDGYLAPARDGSLSQTQGYLKLLNASKENITEETHHSVTPSNGIRGYDCLFAGGINHEVLATEEISKYIET